MRWTVPMLAFVYLYLGARVLDREPWVSDHGRHDRHRRRTRAGKTDATQKNVEARSGRDVTSLRGWSCRGSFHRRNCCLVPVLMLSAYLTATIPHGATTRVIGCRPWNGAESTDQ